MTTPLQQAAQAVIDRWDSPAWKDQTHTAEFIAKLRKALDAELQQSVEPVLWITDLDDPIICKTEFETATFCEDDQRPIPLYLHPPQQAKQVPMTDNEIARIAQLTQSAEPGNDGYILPFTFARAIEAHHNINK